MRVAAQAATDVHGILTSMGTRFAALCLALTLAVACGGGEDEPGRYSELLWLVPNTDAFRAGLVVVDYEAIRALPGYQASRPAGQTDEELAGDPLAFRKALGWHGMVGAPLGILSFENQHYSDGVAILEEGFGISLGAVDRTLAAGVAPPRYLYATAGAFDPDAIEAQAASCERCTPGERRDYRGVAYLTWGGEMALDKRMAPPAFDEFGRGGHFVFTDDYVIRSNFLEDFEASIDASLGEGSLLNDDAYRLASEELDRHELVGLFISTQGYGSEHARHMADQLSENDTLERFALAWEVPAGERLRAFQLFAVGAGLADDEPFTLIVLVHPTEAAAQENVERLNERLATGLAEADVPFASLFTSTEVTSNGRVLLATLRGEDRLGLALNRFEPLLLHE
jgi:hypothetical protein